ncbi:MAG: cox cluster protein [Haloarculaceae archaeon]
MSRRLESVPALRDSVPGERVVLAVYLTALAIAGLFGAIIGVIRPVALDPVLFFVIDLPANALGMVTFGVVTVGTLLGVLLLAVVFVSRYDDRRVE